MAASLRTNPISEHYAELTISILGEFVGQTLTAEIVENLASVVSGHTLELVDQNEAAELLGLSFNGFRYATNYTTASATNPTPAIERPPRWVKADIEAFAEHRAQLASKDSRIKGKKF